MSQVIRRRRITRASPTPEKLSNFLHQLEESGSVTFAAQRAGIGRNTVYERRRTDPALALGWQKAVAVAAESLRDTAIESPRGTARRFGPIAAGRQRCAGGFGQAVEAAGESTPRGTGCGTAGAGLRHIPCAAAPLKGPSIRPVPTAA